MSDPAFHFRCQDQAFSFSYASNERGRDPIVEPKQWGDVLRGRDALARQLVNALNPNTEDGRFPQQAAIDLNRAMGCEAALADAGKFSRLKIVVDAVSACLLPELLPVPSGAFCMLDQICPIYRSLLGLTPANITQRPQPSVAIVYQDEKYNFASALHERLAQVCGHNNVKSYSGKLLAEGNVQAENFSRIFRNHRAVLVIADGLHEPLKASTGWMLSAKDKQSLTMENLRKLFHLPEKARRHLPEHRDRFDQSIAELVVVYACGTSGAADPRGLTQPTSYSLPELFLEAGARFYVGTAVEFWPDGPRRDANLKLLEEFFKGWFKAPERAVDHLFEAKRAYGPDSFNTIYQIYDRGADVRGSIPPDKRPFGANIWPSATAEILCQEFRVSSEIGNEKTGRKLLAFAPARMGSLFPKITRQQVDWNVFNERLDQLRRQFAELSYSAITQARCDPNLLSDAAHQLSSCLLPETGFGGLLVPGWHPQFEIEEMDPVASRIPWEALQDSYGFCPSCQKRFPRAQKHCSECGTKLEARDEYLALTYHMCHIARGPGPSSDRPGNEGQEFLLVSDPTSEAGGDLLSAPNDPDGQCESHLQELEELVKKSGFTPRVIHGPLATMTNVIQALRDPQVTGIYYYGRCALPQESDEGGLILADGRLAIHRIVDAAPRARFVFINACERTFERRPPRAFENLPLNLASAFAQGILDRAVIVPNFQVPNVQGAEFALQFFRDAAQGLSVAEALHHAREFSHARNREGLPDLAFLAFRFFGNPNQRFPSRSLEPAPVPAVGSTPTVDETTAPAPPSKRQSTGVFDENGRLRIDQFAFEIDPVLIRAAKRRCIQGREQIAVMDLLAGLIRAGQLTRFVLRRAGFDPDRIYTDLSSKADPSAPKLNGRKGKATNGAAISDETALGSLIAHLSFGKREDFSAEVVEMFDAITESKDEPISEQALLDVLLDSSAWASLGAAVSSPSAIRQILALQAEDKEVDENGTVPLDDLSPAARQVIEDAHRLSLQCRASQIKHRTLLAAFVAEADRFAAKVCRLGGVDPKLLWALLVAIGHEEDGETIGSGPDFGLTPARCERIVIPTLVRARQSARDPGSISEEELFHAFCEETHPAFKQFLKARAQDPDLEAMEADLDGLRNIQPDQPPRFARLTLRAQGVIKMAHRLAQVRKVWPVPNRLMLAAFVIDENSYAHQLFAKKHLPVPNLRDTLLKSARGSAPADFPLDDQACARIITPTVQRAQALAGRDRFVTERLLFHAFCEVADPQMKASLKPIGFDLDALDFPSSPATESGAQSSCPESHPPGEGSSCACTKRIQNSREDPEP